MLIYNVLINGEYAFQVEADSARNAVLLARSKCGVAASDSVIANIK